MYRTVTYRLVPGTRHRARKMAQTAGACRWVWNHFLAENRQAMDAYRRGAGARPSVNFQSLGVQFTKLRNETPWLKALPYAPVRYVLKYQSDAWNRAFEHGGFPRFKARRGDDSFTIPEKVRFCGDRLHVPRIGSVVLRRRGGNPYTGGRPVKAVVKRVGRRWICALVYKVDEETAPDNGLAVGVDMNCGQVAVSTGDILHQPDIERLEARKRRYQRMMARRQRGSTRRADARRRYCKTQRKIANVRHNWHHHVSRSLATTAGLVVVEDLNVKQMTRTARGTADHPGTNVRRKARLNRSILGTGWRGLRRMLMYKAARLEAVPPMYSSQTCRACKTVDSASRRSQSKFRCVQCGHQGNADVNAALNVLASGTGATGRRGAWALAPPMNRQKVSISRRLAVG